MSNTKINKEHELYKASLSAFFKNEADNDKLILGLSVTAIGFFISLLEGYSDISYPMLIFFIIAVLAFFITAVLILCIFYLNKKQLLKIIDGTGKADECSILEKLDIIKYITFFIAVIASIVLALLILINNNRGISMAGKTNTSGKNTIQQDGVSGLVGANQSKEERGISGVVKANQPKPQPTNTDSKKNK